MQVELNAVKPHILYFTMNEKSPEHPDCVGFRSSTQPA